MASRLIPTIRSHGKRKLGQAQSFRLPRAPVTAAVCESIQARAPGSDGGSSLNGHIRPDRFLDLVARSGGENVRNGGAQGSSMARGLEARQPELVWERAWRNNHGFKQAGEQRTLQSISASVLASAPTLGPAAESSPSSRFSYKHFSSSAAAVAPLLAPQATGSAPGAATEAAGAGQGEMSENEFHRLADEALHWLHERFDALGDEVDIEGFDADLSQGVLTLRLGPHGIFVINKQAPNRQIWLSSPQSGPARFDWLPGQGWVYRRTGSELMSLLHEELGACLGDGVAPSLILRHHT